jgi:phage I-like protein
MPDPKLVDETEVPADEPRFRVPPHFVVDELVRKGTAELAAQVAELGTQRAAAQKATADLLAQVAIVDELKAQVADLQAQRTTLDELVRTVVAEHVAAAAPAVKA